MKERFILLLSASAFLTMLFYSTETISFLIEISWEIGHSVLAALMGLAIKLITSKMGIRKPSEQGEILDEFAGRLLVRRGLLQTFTGLYLWNVILSFAIVMAGSITFGVLPIVWAFLNLGLLSPEINIFKHYLHAWFEEAAVILSVSVGIWGGLKRKIVLFDLGMIPPSFIILILGLYGFSALFETLEIRLAREI